MLADVARFVWPVRCWLCGAEVYGPAGIQGPGEVDRGAGPDPWCSAHAPEVRAGAPHCGRCASELAPGLAPGSTCASCRRRAPAFTEVVAPFSYRHPGMRAAILAFKHGGRRDLAAPLARAMVSVTADRPGPFELLVPVPSHLARRLSRGYDPPGLLADELELAGGGQRASVLRRVRATPPQGSPGAAGRWGNVRGAFRYTGTRLSGERVWLVDDVLASGATADACARSLRAAGAGPVVVLALARA